MDAAARLKNPIVRQAVRHRHMPVLIQQQAARPLNGKSQQDESEIAVQALLSNFRYERFIFDEAEDCLPHDARLRATHANPFSNQPFIQGAIRAARTDGVQQIAKSLSRLASFSSTSMCPTATSSWSFPLANRRTDVAVASGFVNDAKS